MLYQVYLITNKVNNKKYVGQTKKDVNWNYMNRFSVHIDGALDAYSKHKHLTVFQAAIISYGVESFIPQLLEDDVPEDLIDEREIYYISYYNTYWKNNEGYNMTFGGQGVHGYKHEEEIKRLISEKSKEYWQHLKENDPDEYIRLCKIRSIRMKGIPKSEAQRKKLSEHAKLRKGEKNPFYGKKHSQQVKEIIALKNGHPVAMYDPLTGELIRTFNSGDEAARWLIENNLTTNKYAKSRIFYCCDSETRLAYGYKWKKI